MNPTSVINPDTQKTLILDLTYNCNCSCNYCQWSDSNNQQQFSLMNSDLSIPYETLSALGIKRLVFSGGEPIIYPDLMNLVSYYSKFNLSSIIVLTNGLALSKSKLQELWKAGITGLTISLDSINPDIAFQTRGLTQIQLNQTLTHLKIACEFKKIHTFEIGINITLSHANLKEQELLAMLHYLDQFPIDWIKFQPLFDDGFVSQNCPNLKLTEADIPELRKCSQSLPKAKTPYSNSPTFWEELIKILSEQKIDGISCGINSHIMIAIRGEIKFCYWLNDPIYGKVSQILSHDLIQAKRKEFQVKKQYCQTDLYCYCLQKMSHRWYMRK
jgi:cyclic pyranopterin phosphate synthase